MTTQPTPSPHQHEPVPFTTGKFTVKFRQSVGCYAVLVGKQLQFETFGPAGKENANLIAACFNSATALHEAGYDAQRVIEALPEIMAFVTQTHEGLRTAKQAEELVSQLRRTKGTQ